MSTDPMAPRVDIIIPTYNRAHLIRTAVEAALGQSWWNIRVTVIDDHGSDDTRSALRGYFDDPRFSYIRLARNLGTAQAKNAGLLLTDGDAVTFHDSDDIPHRDKVLFQVRALTQPDFQAADCLNWGAAGRRAGERLEVGVALTHHELILPDGRRVEIRRDLSLLDDVFPNLQLGNGVPGEWTHVNSGLFRDGVFRRNGGFADLIEEDRELRNRLILNGEILRVIPELLLTKIETPDSLTQSTVSDYESPRRQQDRLAVWDAVRQWRETGRIDPVPVDIPGFALEEVSAPGLLAPRDILRSPATRAAVAAIWDRWAPTLGRTAAQ